MTSPMEKVCPECRLEYRAIAETCSDCGVALVHPEELTDAAELPPANEMVPIRIAGIGWCRGFSAFLSERGIPHRIDSPPETGEGAETLKQRAHDGGFAVFVLASDRERAQAADADFMRRELPELDQLDARDDDDGACPACGHAVPSNASECPDCGLFVGEPE